MNPLLATPVRRAASTPKQAKREAFVSSFTAQEGAVNLLSAQQEP